MMTPDIETEDYFGMSPQSVQEIMHREEQQVLIDAREYAKDMIKEADGEDWPVKAFHYLGAVHILMRAIDAKTE